MGKRKWWRTADVVELLADARWKIERHSSGGDCDTTSLRLKAVGSGKEESLDVCGFNPGEMLPEEADRDDVQVELIEVSDGQTSRGGLNSSDRPTCLMYGEIVSRLRGAGFSVVPHLKDYF